MKKILLATLLILTSATLWSYPIKGTQLPAQARNFLKNYWPNVKIANADRTGGTYAVMMDDGAAIVFNNKGIWQQIENEYGLPTDFIPATIHQYVRKHYDTSVVCKVARISTGYEVTLDSGYRLYFGTKGNLQRVD